MSKIVTLNVSLPAETVAFLHETVENGEYLNPSEAIRDALNVWKLERRIEAPEPDELRRLVNEGINSGPSLDAEEVFSCLRAQSEILSPEPQ